MRLVYLLLCIWGMTRFEVRVGYLMESFSWVDLLWAILLLVGAVVFGAIFLKDSGIKQ